MNPKISVFIAVSLDGFIARENGDIDWLDAASAALPEGEDCGFRAFFDSIDAMIMGRNTFEKVLTFGNWPYGDMPITVLSRNPISFPDKVPNSVRQSSLEPGQLCRLLDGEGVTHVYLDGGTLLGGRTIPCGGKKKGERSSGSRFGFHGKITVVIFYDGVDNRQA